MDDLKWNKIAASVLIAGLTAMLTGVVTDALYKPEKHLEHRGYTIEGAEEAVAPGGAPKVEVKLDIPALMAKADAKLGADVFKKCVSCHSVEQGGPNKVGPNQYGVVGGVVGHNKEFSYSKAMSEAHAAGKKWDYEALFAFLKSPKQYLPGTKMSFAGLSKPEDIANVIAYMRENGSTGYPLP